MTNSEFPSEKYLSMGMYTFVFFFIIYFPLFYREISILRVWLTNEAYQPSSTLSVS